MKFLELALGSFSVIMAILVGYLNLISISEVSSALQQTTKIYISENKSEYYFNKVCQAILFAFGLYMIFNYFN